ncbi:MAG TPA: pirin family protein [Burkholderiaceae bacterium]|nr:pirin family protein [Burkholderiaceae bacterium]
MSARPVIRSTRGIQTSDGAGVRLRRLMGGGGAIPSIDPFLMLDYFDTANAGDYIAGFPAHPHRGFETVTYMLNGRVRHRDNHGGEGVIEPGGVQWMTAGRGVVHSEMPEQTEGLMRGFQLWVNLPARLKMTAPAYQEHSADRMPVEERAGGVRVKVIAGTTSSGTRGPVTAEATDARYFDVELTTGSEFTEALPVGHAAFVVVHQGRVDIDGQIVEAVGLAELGDGDSVVLRAAEGPARALLIAGKPLHEPVAWHGPFVMNTYEELVQAVEDYQAGRF